MTTIGVLFKNADIEATVGSIVKYPRVSIEPPLEGKMRFTMGDKHPLRRIPSLTRNSSATVIIPLLAKPANASEGVIIPQQSSTTTVEKSINPGRR